MKKIKVMIAEDHPIFRKTLVDILSTDRIEVIGDAANGQILIDLVKINVPDIVLLDLKMPVLDGHKVLKIFAKDFTTIRTVVFSYDDAPFFITDAIIDGARAYLNKESDPEDLIAAVEEVYDEGYFFNDLFSKEILLQVKSQKKIYYLIGDQRFSEREIEIIRLSCEELTVEQIADQLNISVNTVNDHKKKIFKKTDSNNIVSLIKYATRQGIIGPENFDKKL